jgi:uncharacterized membrane protein YfcA
MELFSTLILSLSGLCAGLMTGLIGASAVTFMAGILMVFLNYRAYEAIGISLITDVFASLISAHIYKKAKNIDIKKGLTIGTIAIIFAFIGSILARKIPDLALGDGLGIIILITGITFLNNPTKLQKHKLLNYFKKRKNLASIIIGTSIGLFCGIFGVGGGITILIALIFIMGYPIKIAIGTSILIMAFISLSGGIGHFVAKEFPTMDIIITSISAIIGAIIASKYTNKIPEEKIFKTTGIILIIMSIIIIFKKFFYMIILSFF